jgi:hypothetical protein
MSKNKTENAITKYLILSHLSQGVIRCKKMQKLKCSFPDADTFQEWVDAATDEEKKYATLISYTSPVPWTRWNPPAKNTRPTSSSSSNQQAVPMDIDIIRKAINEAEEEDKEEKIRLPLEMGLLQDTVPARADSESGTMISSGSSETRWYTSSFPLGASRLSVTVLSPEHLHEILPIT